MFGANELSEFFIDFGVLAQLRFANGTTRDITAIFDSASFNAEMGSYELDTEQPQITARSTDVQDLRWKVDAVFVNGRGYDVVLSPQADGTGVSVVKLALAEHP